MTTQRDIASRLGVSVTTVSLALRNDQQISDGLRTQIQALASEMGYVYRPRKRSRIETRQVAFVGRYGATSVFYLPVLHGAERACQKHDMTLHYVQLEDAVQGRLLRDDVDAIMMVSSIEREAIEHFKRLGLPMVLVDNNLPRLQVDRVLIENYDSLYRTVIDLAGWGHQRILFVRGPGDIPSFCDRARGYRAAMGDLGLEATEIQCDDTSSVEGAKEQVLRWLTGGDRPDFTALIACNDKTAIGAIYALQDVGLRVPEDISVVGFDDIDMARVVRPQLTTVHVYRELLGEYGVNLLVERIKTPSRPAVSLALDTVLVERASTRRLG